MLTTLLGSIALATSLADGAPPPITVSLNNGGQYSRGDYAKAQFQAAADGYILLLQADQDGRVRVLFPLDPGDDNFIRGGKTYKVIGRDSRGSFYLDQAGGSGMVYVAWSKSPFRFTDFVRGDHWDYTVLDQYNASDDPEGQLTDLVLQMTSQGFDYAIDRYIVYSIAEYSAETTTYVGVSGWPWPTYYTGGWGVGITFGSPCCYNPWYWNSWYPAYGWGYPAYGWGYPAYGWGYPGYGYGGGYYPYYPGYGDGYYPGYGGGYAGYRPYTFKPGGTITTAGNPYRPRADAFAPRSEVFQTGYRRRMGEAGASIGRSVTDAATISGRADAGRRPVARTTRETAPSRPRSDNTARPIGGSAGGGTRRSGTDGTTSAAPKAGGGVARRSTPSQGTASPRTRSEASPSGGDSRARGWSADGTQRPATSSRPRGEATSPGGERRSVGSGGGQARRNRGAGPARAGTGSPSAQPPSRSPGYSPAPRSGAGSNTGGGGARSGGGGGSNGGGARSGGGGGGGGGGRRGR